MSEISGFLISRARHLIGVKNFVHVFWRSREYKLPLLQFPILGKARQAFRSVSPGIKSDEGHIHGVNFFREVGLLNILEDKRTGSLTVGEEKSKNKGLSLKVRETSRVSKLINQ
jgi:hypothetical protein